MEHKGTLDLIDDMVEDGVAPDVLTKDRDTNRKIFTKKVTRSVKKNTIH